MVLIHFKITLQLALQVEQSVLAERLKHVVKETDWILDITVTAAVKIQRKSNLCFLCVAFNCRYPVHDSFLDFFKSSLCGVHIQQYPWHPETGAWEAGLEHRSFLPLSLWHNRFHQTAD